MILKRILFVLLITLLLSSCVHHSPFREEYYFQALGREGEVVVTADGESIRRGDADEIVGFSAKDNAIIKKADRITVSIEDETVSGAVEGNISKWGTNSLLSLSSSFDKVKDGEGKTVWYTDSLYSLYSPENGILLFSSGDYSSFYERSYLEREKRIDDETASLMASSSFSVYIYSPESLSSLGFDIPQTVMDGITRVCLLFNNKEGEIKMSGFIETVGESEARALNTILRNQIIQDKRREGEALDIKALSNVFAALESSVVITDYTLTGKMKESASNLIESNVGGLL